MKIDHIAPDEKLLMKHEGFQSHPYTDTSGHLTIGYGCNLDVGLTEREALALLRIKTEIIREKLKYSFPWYNRLSAARQAVLVNMTYNLGFDGLLGFRKMLAALAEGNYRRAAMEMLDSKWANQVGSRSSELAEIIVRGTLERLL